MAISFSITKMPPKYVTTIRMTTIQTPAAPYVIKPIRLQYDQNCAHLVANERKLTANMKIEQSSNNSWNNLTLATFSHHWQSLQFWMLQSLTIETTANDPPALVGPWFTNRLIRTKLSNQRTSSCNFKNRNIWIHKLHYFLVFDLCVAC